MNGETIMSLTTLEKVQRLVKFATGEEYGDYEMVTGVSVGYAEPGYGNDESVVVLGNWNDKTEYNRETGTFTTLSDLPSRLARSLERVGAEIEWLDEWTECQSCWRVVRTQGDSYHWKPSYECVEDAGPICADCLIKDGEDAITGYGNDENSHISSADNGLRPGITWCEPSHIEQFGFVKWEPGNEHTYESGWHPGQTDEPQPILDEILRQHPTAEVLFFLDESSQFYIRFSAYFRVCSCGDSDVYDGYATCGIESHDN